MSLEIGPLPPINPGPRRFAGPAAAERARAGSARISVTAFPPPEVLDAVGAAADRAEELARDNRELHFRTDEETGRVVIEVRDLEGTVIRTMPPSEALDVMAGASL